MRWLCFDSNMDKYTSSYKTRNKEVYELAKVSFLYDFMREDDTYIFTCPYTDRQFKSKDYMKAFAEMKHELECVAVQTTEDPHVIDGCCVTPAVSFEQSVMKWRFDDS